MDHFAACPCGNVLVFSKCCLPYLSGEASAPSPEKLMRSRYSAYACGNYAYIANTYAISHSGYNGAHQQNKQISENEIAQSSEGTKWCKLDVLSAYEQKQKGEVEFIAYYQREGKFYAMHELSRFIRSDSQWFYVDGDAMDKSGHVKLGRNDECLCGSGKKFKRCCYL